MSAVSSNPHDTLAPRKEALTAAGFSIATRNEGKHWIVSGRGLRLNHWPTSAKWMVFGRVWKSSAQAVIRAIEQGRIRMPAEANCGSCRYCGAEIWWVHTARGKPMPIEADGDAHIARCAE